MKTDDSIFLDTNILVYAHQENAPFHNQSKDLRDMALKGELALCISPQVLTEFYSTITNPKRVTHPISSEKAAIEVEKYFVSRRIRKIYPQKETVEKLIDLLKVHPVKQMEIFDLQLVATMLSNGVSRIYTFNVNDFKKYVEIEVLEP